MLLLSGEKIAACSHAAARWFFFSCGTDGVCSMRAIVPLGVYWIGNRVSKMEIPLRRNRMRFAFVLTAGLALAVAVFAADVAGTWKGTLETPMGPMENTIVLAADGASLTVRSRPTSSKPRSRTASWMATRFPSRSTSSSGNWCTKAPWPGTISSSTLPAPMAARSLEREASEEAPRAPPGLPNAAQAAFRLQNHR